MVKIYVYSKSFWYTQKLDFTAYIGIILPEAQKFLFKDREIHTYCGERIIIDKSESIILN